MGAELETANEYFETFHPDWDLEEDQADDVGYQRIYCAKKPSLATIAEEHEDDPDLYYTPASTPALSESSSSVPGSPPLPKSRIPVPTLSPLKIPKRTSSLSQPITPPDDEEEEDARLTVSSDVTAQREARAEEEREKATRDLFKPLEPDMEKLVSRAVLVGGGGFTAQSLRRIYPSSYLHTEAWLDDEAVNGYLDLICRVANTAAGVESGATPVLHAFNSHFFETYASTDGLQKVCRWFKRAKLLGTAILDADTVFIPICKGGNHWVLLVLKPKDRKISFFDSMGGTGRQYMGAMEDILTAVMGNDFQKGQQWSMEDSAACPRQRNTDDCGVYVATIAKFVSFGLDLEFSAADISAQRQIMVAELVEGRFMA